MRFLAKTANPRQQGLKQEGIIGWSADTGAKTANPRQQGLKLFLLDVFRYINLAPKRLIQDNKD